MENQEFSGMNAGQVSTSNGGSHKTDLHHIQDQIMEKANDLGRRVTDTMDRAKDKTCDTLQTTSRKIDQMANYLHDTSYQDMASSVTQIIRQHPGKSVLISLGLGMLFSRALR